MRSLAVIIYLVAAAVADPALQKKYLQHVSAIGRFKKAGPQPRLVNVTESVDIATNEMFLPKFTVLYRCDNQTGCCGDKDPGLFQCGPDYDHVQQVNVLFHVSDFSTGTNEIRSIEMQNHTRCECKLISH